MSNFNKLLERELEAEIDYVLQNKFITYASKQNKYLYKEGLLKELSQPVISLKRIKQYTGIDLYKTNESYQMFILTDSFDYKKGTYDKKKIVKNSVLLKYFLKSTDVEKKEAAIDILMCLHCGNYKSLEFLPGIDTLNMIRDFDTKLSSKVFPFDHFTAIKFLNYFYKQKDRLLDDEYKNLLSVYAVKMKEYLDFYGLGNIDFMNIDLNMNYEADDSNYKLISFFYGKEIPMTRNKYYDLKLIKELLAKEDNKKDMLITSLCMFDVDDQLIKNYKDIQLGYADLKEYIDKYEDAGNILTVNQFEKLLINFRKYYFYSHNQQSEYESDIEYVKRRYEEYCYDNYDHSPLEFIQYFNEKEGYLLSHFSLIGNEPLNKAMFNEIINNIPASIQYFSTTKSAENYVMTVEDNKKREFDTKKYIKDKYYDLLDGYMAVKNITFGYFLIKFVPEEDREDVIELANWYCKKYNTTLESSADAKAITARVLFKDLEKDIMSGLFKDRYAVSERYKVIIEENDLEDYLPISLQYYLRKITKEKLDAILPLFIHDFNESIKNGDNPYLVVEKYGLKNIDAKSLLKRTYPNVREYQKKVKLMTDGANKYRSEQFKAKQDAKEQRRIQILSGYATSELGIREYAKENDLSVKELLTWIEENNDQAGMEKYKSELEVDVSRLDNFDAVIFGINNGVESGIGVRRFTFFDLLMLQDEVISLSEVEKILTDPVARETPGYSIINTRRFLGRTKGTTNFLSLENYDDSVGISRDVSQVMSLNITIPTEDGNKTITNEEKEYVLGFIDEMGYPRRVFLDALIAHANGDYDFEAKRRSVVKKKTNN